MVDISARLQSQEIREIFVTHLRLSPEKGEQVLGIYEKLRSAIILAKPIDFNKTLLTCKRHLEYPTDLGFYDDIDKYSEADKRANLITEITEAEVLWKLNKESAYQVSLHVSLFCRSVESRRTTHSIFHDSLDIQIYPILKRVQTPWPRQSLTLYQPWLVS